MKSAVGSPTEALHAAIELLVLRGAVIRAASPLYQTPAFPAGSGPDYVNGALAIVADWSAQEALTHLHAVEAELGRSRRARWEQRVIDLDLLAAGDLVRPDIDVQRHWMDLPFEQQKAAAPEQMILPHPRMHERAFVLVPLADIAPNWVHPVLGLSVAQMLDALPAKDRAQIKVLD